MLATQRLWMFLILALDSMSSCEAGPWVLPAPTGLSYQWLDQFTLSVKWSWRKPENLPQDCNIIFSVDQLDVEPPKKFLQCSGTHFEEKYLMKPNFINEKNFSIKALCKPSTEEENKLANITNPTGRESEPSTIIVPPPKPYAEMVTDFKCLIQPNKLNCSWIPVDPSQNLKLSYRKCGATEDLKQCDAFYNRGGRMGCLIDRGNELGKTWVAVETEDKMYTFEPKLVVPVPELNITEEADYLILTWTPPEVGQDCAWEYNVWYKQCNVETLMKSTKIPGSSEDQKIPYNKCCKYQFQYNVTTDSKCYEVFSDTSSIIDYGTPCTSIATVIAIIIPVILFICMMLSFYCFRRHRSIICPEIPEPSDFFKEMMNGNSATKVVPVPLYTPLPEPVESKNITLLPKKSILLENS